MPDELTLEDALKEFKGECLLILRHQVSTFKKDPYDNWYCEDEAGSLTFVTRDKLIVTAIKWLQGKFISEDKMFPGPAGQEVWPEPLRWLLEEVRNHY